MNKIIPCDKDLNNMLTMLKVLQDKTRLKIVFALMNGKKCVSELVTIVGKSQSAISHQLIDMKSTNLVKSEKLGNRVIYSLADDHVSKVVKLCLVHAQEF